MLEAPANGRTDITGDTATHTPNPGFKGEDPFVIGITDDGFGMRPWIVRLGLSATVLAGCGGCSGLGSPTSLAGMLALGSAAARRRRGSLARPHGPASPYGEAGPSAVERRRRCGRWSSGCGVDDGA